MSNKFKVQTAAAFINSGPRFGSREEKLAIQAEENARDQREALAQTRRDDYQTRRSRMSPVERAYDDMELLCEMNKQVRSGMNQKLRNEIAATWKLIEELENE